MTEMTLVDAPSRPTAVVRGRLRPQDLPAFLTRAFEQARAAVDRQGIHVAGPPLTVYRAVGGDVFEVEAGFPVVAEVAADGDVVPGRLPGGHTVEAVHIGPYETLPETYGQILAWVREHGLQPGAVMWEAYLTDPDDAAHRHEAGPRTLVVQPVEPAPVAS